MISKRRGRVLAVAAAATACAMAFPGAANAARRSAESTGWVTKEVQVSSPYVDYTETSGDGMRCDHFTTNDGRCRLLTAGSARWSGTMQGEATYLLDTWQDNEHPGRLLYEGFGDEGNHFTDVVIEGCGRGGFDMEEWDGFVDVLPPADYDVVTNRGKGFNRWRVRARSGTGDLEGLSGSGINVWTYHSADHPVQYGNYGEGLFTGTFTCRVPAPAASQSGSESGTSAASKSSGALVTRPGIDASAGAPATSASSATEMAGAASVMGAPLVTAATGQTHLIRTAASTRPRANRSVAGALWGLAAVALLVTSLSSVRAIRSRTTH